MTRDIGQATSLAADCSRRPSRRTFLALSGALLTTLPAGTAAARAIVPPAPPAPRTKTLGFLHRHTGEEVKATYWTNGDYLGDGVAEIAHLLRDWRTEEVAPINVKLLDFLFDIRTSLQSDAPFHVVSGYRSPKTNAMLASKSKRVAKNSLHMQGMAVDVKLPGRKLSAVRSVARQLRRGGVGYYPRSGFLHLDVGPVRAW